MKMKVRLSYVRVMVIAAALGLIAKVTVPETGQASIESNTTELIEALVQMRGSLGLYRAEHDGRLPFAKSSEAFEMVLTRRIGQYGPYINEIPENPFNGLDTVRFDGQPAGNNTAGWRLDTKTGIFQADNGPAYSVL
jgi:hypothetical protein